MERGTRGLGYGTPQIFNTDQGAQLTSLAFTDRVLACRAKCSMDGRGRCLDNLAADVSPCAEHILDWFHLTMRFTVLGQYAKGLAHHDEERATGGRPNGSSKRIKGYLWNGNHRDALPCIDGLVDDLQELATTYPSINAFRKGVDEFRTYVRRNAGTIANYAERHRHCERVSTAFAESTVNTGGGKTLLETPADALVKTRGAPDASDPNAGAGRHAQGEVPELVSRALFHVQTPDHSEHETRCLTPMDLGAS